MITDRKMNVGELRAVLETGGRVKYTIGPGLEDPINVVYLAEGMVMCETIGGWCAGTVEPMCRLDSDFLAERLEVWQSIETFSASSINWMLQNVEGVSA